MPDPSAQAGTIQTIWRYAVKSMAPEEIDDALMTEHGILGDRCYALIDQTTGKVASAKMPKMWGGLLQLAAAFTEAPVAGQALPPVRITWPDGSEAVTSGGDPEGKLSATVDRAVELTTTKPAEVSLERLDPLAEEEEILDIGDIMMEGRFSDYAAVHMLTTASLAKLSAISPDISFDAIRFRPNLIIEAPADAEGFIENDWVGRTVCIGDDVRLRISDPTPRCSIPTLAQKGGVTKDPKVLRTIVQHNSQPVPLLDDEVLPCVGVYGFVEQGGTFRKGDPVRVV